MYNEIRRIRKQRREGKRWRTIFLYGRQKENNISRIRSCLLHVCLHAQTIVPGPSLQPQGLLAFQNGGGSGEDPGTQQITCLQRGWRCIQNGGYGEKGEKNWVRDAKVKINKMAEKAEVQFKKK